MTSPPHPSSLYHLRSRHRSSATTSCTHLGLQPAQRQACCLHPRGCICHCQRGRHQTRVSSSTPSSCRQVRRRGCRVAPQQPRTHTHTHTCFAWSGSGASKTRGVLGVVKHSGSLEADGSGHRTIGVVMHTVVNGTGNSSHTHTTHTLAQLLMAAPALVGLFTNYAGLHRMVTRDVVLAAPPPEAGNLSSCSIVAAQRFQPALYADLDEIRVCRALGCLFTSNN